MSQPRLKSASALMNVMAGAAFKAARGLVRDFNEVEHLQVSQKGPGDFVSAADFRSEKVIHQELQKARPDFGFLMEESGEIIGADARHRWIVDPLDGTTNFLHAIPHFCISIGLEFDGEIMAGVIYDPIKDEMFHAEKGRGAFVNDRRIRVSSRAQLSNCLLVTTRLTHKIDPGQTQSISDKAKKLTLLTAGLRHFGAAALDLCYVAAGRFDGFFAYNLSPWDIAAGLVIVREAGGQVDELSGQGSLYETGAILASNGKIHDKLRQELS
ncbi:MAG: inositol monophosphatase family protein [Janthinobacterium lividum]